MVLQYFSVLFRGGGSSIILNSQQFPDPKTIFLLVYLKRCLQVTLSQEVIMYECTVQYILYISGQTHAPSLDPSQTPSYARDLTGEERSGN